MEWTDKMPGWTDSVEYVWSRQAKTPENGVFLRAIGLAIQSS